MLRSRLVHQQNLMGTLMGGVRALAPCRAAGLRQQRRNAAWNPAGRSSLSLGPVKPTTVARSAEVSAPVNGGVDQPAKHPEFMDAVYLKRPLQEGEVVEYPGRSVVVVGDVPKGCRVIAGGDVVVLGELLGEVVAGAQGSSDASVVALKLAPQSISIAGTELPSAQAQAASGAGPQLAALSGATGVVQLSPFAPGLLAPPAAGGDKSDLKGKLISAGVLLLGTALALSPVSLLGAFHLPSEGLVASLLDVLVYGYILLKGANLLSDGSELLLEILNPGIVGGVVLPTLGALPDSLIILVSGLGVSREVAQQQVAVGVGTLAGSTILLLSLAWGGGILLGRTDLNAEGKMVDKTLSPGATLSSSGISTDSEVPTGAVIMMITVLFYGIVQVPAILGDTDDPTASLIGAVVCLASAAAYCAYQVLSPELQKRKIEAARQKRLRLLALRAISASSSQFGSMLAADGGLSRATANRIFDTFDHDKSGHIDKNELQALIVGLELGGGRDKPSPEAVDAWSKELDADQDALISRDEFYTTINKWVKDRAAETGVVVGGKLSDAEVTLLSISDEEAIQLQETALALGKDELKGEVVEEEEERLGEPLSRGEILGQAALKMGGGIALCAAFSDPLVEALSGLSEATGIPPFFMGFVLAPLASNASELVSSLKFASKRRERNLSLTLAQVYGAVTMNNTLVLGLFLLVVHLQQLEWIYSSEVAVVVGSTILVGLLGARGTTIPAYYGLIAAGAYPISLAAVWGLDTFLGWQ